MPACPIPLSKCHGKKLLDMLRDARSQILLVSPYIKRRVFLESLAVCDPAVDIRVYTRWTPEDIMCGSSDLGVWEDIMNFGGEIYNVPSLHAKYYRGDEHILVGSSNLTSSGMAWGRFPNLEILISPDTNFDSASFEEELDHLSSPITESDYLAFKALERIEIDQVSGRNGVDNCYDFVPRTYNIRLIYRAYKQGVENLNLDIKENSRVLNDLDRLAVPECLSEDAFYSFIRARLSFSLFFRKVKEFSLQGKEKSEYVSECATLRAQSEEETNLQVSNILYWLSVLHD